MENTIDTFDILDELKKFLLSLDEESLMNFKKYCLGDRGTTGVGSNITKLSIDDYLKIIKASILSNSNLGYKFITYRKRSQHIGAQFSIPSLWNNDDMVPSVFVSKGNKKAKYVYSFNNIFKNPCMILLCHNDIISYDGDEIETFASKWHDFIIQKFIQSWPVNAYSYCNKNTIYRSFQYLDNKQRCHLRIFNDYYNVLNPKFTYEQFRLTED